MLVEKSRDEALKAFLRGRKVRVLMEYEDGSLAAEALEEWLPEEDTHYLVNVPAVEKDEFAALGRISKPVISGPEADPETDVNPAEEVASAADTLPAEDSFSGSGKSKLEVVRELNGSVEELEIAPEIICDKYCKYPGIAKNQEEPDGFCEQCELQGLLRALVG